MLKFFDLTRRKKTIDHMQEYKLIRDDIAKQFEQENKKMYEETYKKAEEESKRHGSLRRFQSPDPAIYHHDNSTPSVNRSSVKLPLGQNAFQDYAQDEIFEMTPSNLNRMCMDHDSQYSAQTYGNSQYSA